MSNQIFDRTYMIKEEIKDLEELMKEKNRIIEEYKQEINSILSELWNDVCLLDKLHYQLELEEEQKEELE